MEESSVKKNEEKKLIKFDFKPIEDHPLPVSIDLATRLVYRYREKLSISNQIKNDKNKNKNENENENENDKNENGNERKKNLNIEDLPIYLAKFNSEKKENQIESLQYICVLSLSQPKNFAFEVSQILLECGIVPKLVLFLENQDLNIQKLTTWIMINMMSHNGEYAASKSLTEYHALPRLVSLIKNTNLELSTQAMWALVNLCADGNEFVNVLMENKLFEAMHESLQKHIINNKIVETRENGEFLLQFTELLHASTKNWTQFKYMKEMISNFALLLYCKDEEIVNSTVKAIERLVNSKHEKNENNINVFHVIDQAIVKTNIVPKLIQLSNGKNKNMAMIVMGIFNDMVCVDEKSKFSRILIEEKIFSVFEKILNQPSSALKKRICFTISNLSCEDQFVIQNILDAKFLETMVQILKEDDVLCREDCLYTIVNILDLKSSSEQKVQILKLVPLASFCGFLEFELSKHLVSLILNTINNILEMTPNNLNVDSKSHKNENNKNEINKNENQKNQINQKNKKCDKNIENIEIIRKSPAFKIIFDLQTEKNKSCALLAKTIIQKIST